MAKPLWTPNPERIAVSRISHFIDYLNGRHALSLDGYDALYRWSVEHSDAFWSGLWDWSGVVASAKGERVLLRPGQMPGARWFPDARLNFAENLLRDRGPDTAVVFRDESGRRHELSHAELFRRVAALAGALRRHGILPGDRIAGYMPNIPDTLIAMLAASAVGAVWSSCSPDFGVHGVVERFGQIRPRILLSADGYRYNGKRLDCLAHAADIARQIDSVEQLLIVPYLDDDPDLGALPAGTLQLGDFIDTGVDEIEFEQLPFDHPLYILYSSGTTGVPKCIVHGAGGTLLQHLKEHRLHTDLGHGDLLFYYTTCGWMMWNWLVSALASGSAILLYDGSPTAPTPAQLWHIAEAEGISVFGASARYFAALEKAGARPGASHRLPRLRAVLSTGSPLSHESFEYVYRDIKQDLQLSSISGGTDIISCFALGCPVRPVYKGELQCRGLGMAVDIFDTNGQALPRGKGELVCTRPFPSMPLGFWDDPGGERYRDAYFSRFDNVWAHGDFAELTEHDGLIIHGRSDAVLNPGGVRIGTAEIYRQAESLDEVLESLCIGQPWQGDVRVVLFVHLREGVTLDEGLRDRIRHRIRENTTPRHVPAKIVQVSDIPRTLSGKIVELAVRSVVMGETVANRDALANPEALELYRDLPELKA
ncbi:acetoacetyl-CoA synthetase [Marinobacterium nitratireducens]|uniref:Acetoacetyl-CoA synthetase n=1 Tax=Marinobacterium nitratireducens TaxID=518897 RepID=A0A917Z7R9_9GAMM|nr:acetoacetate--CoA ligase [Marinobacterium nitratireducens]GGO77052.1 acetoacetyl-CoA synthetase [Marinobacterium nitratireducens]